MRANISNIDLLKVLFIRTLIFLSKKRPFFQNQKKERSVML